MFGFLRKNLDKQCYEVDEYAKDHSFCFARSHHETLYLSSTGVHDFPCSIQRILDESIEFALCPQSICRLIWECEPLFEVLEELREQRSHLIDQHHETEALVSSGRAVISVDLWEERRTTEDQIDVVMQKAARLYRRIVSEMEVVNIDVEGADPAVVERAKERSEYIDLFLDQFENSC